MKFDTNSIVMPSSTNAAATSHTAMIGANMIAIPSAMNKTPGMINVKPDDGFSMMPLQVSAIGHIGIGVGVGSAMTTSMRRTVLVPAKADLKKLVELSPNWMHGPYETADAHVAKNVRLAGNTLDVQGSVDGYGLLTGTTVTLNAQVGGDVYVEADHLELGPDARVGGDFHYATSDPIDIQPGVVTSGEVIREEVEAGFIDLPIGLGTSVILVSLASLLIGGVLLLLFFPRFSGDVVARFSQHPLQTVLIGLGTLVVLVIAIAVLMVSVVGTLLGVVLVLALPAVILLGWAVGAFTAAGAIWSRWHGRAAETWVGRVGLLLMGLVVFGLIGLVPLLGPLVLLLAAFIGVGATTARLFESRRVAPHAI